jgi:hypothetical protein
MKTSRHAHSAWLERTDTSGPPRLRVDSDQDRAPISFGWWAQTANERTSKHFHIETIYRLDRVASGKGNMMLTPSNFYGMSEPQAREYLMARQAALLPKIPNGYRWIGPQLIENVVGTPRIIAYPFPGDLLPEPVRQRLQLARALACAALRRRAGGLDAAPQP